MLVHTVLFHLIHSNELTKKKFYQLRFSVLIHLTYLMLKSYFAFYV